MKTLDKLAISALVLVLAGCETASSRTSAGFSDAAMTPLNDLNVRRDEVPPLLAAIRSAYEPIPDVSCSSISKMVADLTAILGRDTDAPPLPERSFGEVAGEGAADITLGAVSSTMSVMIPPVEKLGLPAVGRSCVVASSPYGSRIHTRRRSSKVRPVSCSTSRPSTR